MQLTNFYTFGKMEKLPSCIQVLAIIRKNNLFSLTARMDDVLADPVDG